MSETARAKWSMRILPVLLALLAPCVPPAVHALEPDKAFQHYVRSQWSVRQGLPQVRVTAIAQDHRGYLWVGSQIALTRFDGVSFVNYTPQTEPALPGGWIRALLPGRDGRLWIGTYRGLAFHDGHRFTAVPPAAAWRGPALDVAALAQDAQGTVWVGTGEGLFRVHDGRLHPVAGAPAGPIHAVLARRDGVWLGGTGAVYRPTARGWQRLPMPEQAATAPVETLQDAQGRVWAATTRGLFVLDAGSWRPLEDARLLTGIPVDLLYPDRDGNLWAASDLALVRIRDRRAVETIRPADPGSILEPARAFEDREGNLWLGTTGSGLFRLSNGWTRRYSVAHGLHTPFLWSLTPDPDGSRIWVGSSDGLAVLENGRFRVVATGEALPHPTVAGLLAEPDRLWVGSVRGMTTFEQAGPQADSVQYPPPFGTMADVHFNSVLRGRDGDLWMSTTNGVLRWDGQRLHRYGTAQGLSDPRTRYIRQTRDGRMLAGSQSGLFALRGARFHPLGLDRGLPQGLDIIAIGELADGRLMIGTLHHGTFFEHDGRWHALGPDQGMPSNAPFVMVEHRGHLWLAGIEGVTRVPVAELAALARGRIERVRGKRVLTEMDKPGSGEQGECCNGAGVSSGFLRGDTLWLPTNNGVVAVDTVIKTNPVPPVAVIERVKSGEEWRPAWSLESRTLPVDARDLSFEFTVLSLQDPKNIGIEYRLFGYDREWHAGDPLNRATRYTNLAPGDYTFEVRGTNNSGVPTRAPARLAFSIQPRFHETALFVALLAALAATLLFAGYRYQQYRYRQQRSELQMLVQQRTEALEIANQQLDQASQTDPLTGLRNRRYMANQIPSDLAFYDRQLDQGVHQGEAMVFALADIDHFKAVNDRHGHGAGDLVLQQFAQVLGGLVRTGDYVVRWGGEEFLLVFRPMPARHLAVIGERLRTAVAAHAFDIGNGHVLHLTASIGLAEYPLFRDQRGQVGWETMVALADQAMYYVKAHGRDGWAAFRPNPRTRLSTLLQDLQSNAQALIERGELQLLGSHVEESD